MELREFIGTLYYYTEIKIYTHNYNEEYTPKKTLYHNTDIGGVPTDILTMTIGVVNVVNNVLEIFVY